MGNSWLRSSQSSRTTHLTIEYSFETPTGNPQAGFKALQEKAWTCHTRRTSLQNNQVKILTISEKFDEFVVMLQYRKKKKKKRLSVSDMTKQKYIQWNRPKLNAGIDQIVNYELYFGSLVTDDRLLMVRIFVLSLKVLNVSLAVGFSHFCGSLYCRRRRFHCVCGTFF